MEGSSTTSETGLQHPERFDPSGGKGRLIDTEHHARYWWIAQLALDKEVLDAGCGFGYGTHILAEAGARRAVGLDIDQCPLAEAECRHGDVVDSFVRGDVRNLPFEDGSFDLVACFETIEHLEDPERALAQFARVLAPAGVLAISSPNPDVYPAGNPHHHHEYRPQELAAALGEYFSEVSTYCQHAWLASAIESTHSAKDPEPPRLRRTATLAPGAETYGIVLAAQHRPPDLPKLVSLGEALEVGWWEEQVDAARREAEKAQGEARTAIAAAEADAREAIAGVEREAQRQIEMVENNSRRAVAQAEAREAAARERLQDTAGRLLDANQDLAQLPLMEHQLATLGAHHDRLHETLAELLSSRSWRLSAPLRWPRLALGKRRRDGD